MIIREILRDPLDLAEHPFDYFNDYDDTLCYLRACDEYDCPMVIRLLVAGYREWLKSYNQRFANLLNARAKIESA